MMAKNEFDGGSGNQTASAGAPAGRRGAPSLAPVPRLLLDRHEAAAAMGLSPRTFEELMDEDWMPVPLQLGPRLLRWSSTEIQEAIGRMPRRVKQEAVRTRIAALKGKGGAE